MQMNIFMGQGQIKGQILILFVQCHLHVADFDPVPAGECFILSKYLLEINIICFPGQK